VWAWCSAYLPPVRRLLSRRTCTQSRATRSRSVRLRPGRFLGGAALYAALLGALGAATGSLVRNQVAVIVGWLVWLLLAENIIVGLVPDIGRWLPGAAGRGLVMDPNGDFLAQPVAAVVLASYAIAIAILAIVVERRRDA